MTRILFITYEHTIGIFSGNGVYAKSQTSALDNLGHDVVVLSACSDAAELAADESNAIRVRVLLLPLVSLSCVVYLTAVVETPAQ